MTPKEQAIFDKAKLFYKGKEYGYVQRVQGFIEGYNQCKSEYGGYNPEAMEDLVKTLADLINFSGVLLKTLDNDDYSIPNAPHRPLNTMDWVKAAIMRGQSALTKSKL